VIPADLVDDVKESELCEMFHCLPSQLDGEDYHRLMRTVAIRHAIQGWRANEAELKRHHAKN
jgi:hypothetical protein